MISATLYIFFIVLIVGPALLGVRQLKEWREGQAQMENRQMLVIGGLFVPAAFFLMTILIYLMGLIMLFAGQ
jgi:nitrate reductase gamma subunit